MYVIVEGKVAIVSEGEHGKTPLAELKKDDYFGEMALFDDAPRSATAVAKENVRVLTIYKREFKDMLREYPGISIAMCEEFCKRLRRTNEMRA
jgi:CRP-like cAMP-binding protein